MKKFFVFVLTATMVVACQSRKEPVATMELQEEGISGDTLYRFMKVGQSLRTALRFFMT